VGGVITNCADLTDNDKGYPFLFDESKDSDYAINKLELKNISRESSYTKYGWDFAVVWKITSSGSNYKLPILRGSFEKEQLTITMPAHLRI
jgi:hypothetical protein